MIQSLAFDDLVRFQSLSYFALVETSATHWAR